MFDRGSNTYKSDLVLGERYKDEATDVEGVLVGIHFYQHACERGTLRYVDGNRNVKEATFDAPELVHVETKKAARSERPGGPDRGAGRTAPASRL